MYLSGVGVARGRMEVAKGMKESIKVMLDEKQITTEDIMHVLLVSQYLDTLAAIGSNELMLTATPGEVFDLKESMPSSNTIPDLLC